MKILRFGIGILFIGAGLLHFVRPKPYLAMMPPWIPMHSEAVAVSGVAEIVGGLALFSDRTSRFGCWWLIALLVAVFPANAHMAINPEQIKGLDQTGIPNWTLWARLPLQAVAIWLIWLATKPIKDDGQD
ncbi:MAG: DoxX family membrane protein [Solirubrobacterales bacterium]